MSQRIVFIADHIAHWNAGTERQLLLLGTELKKRGWQVPLYVFKRSDALVDGRWPDEVTNLDCPRISSPVTWSRLFRTGRKEKRQGTRVAHCFFNDSSMVVPPIFSMIGMKTVVSRRDMGFWYTQANLKVLRFVRRFVSTVVANSRAVADNVCQSEGYERDRVVVVYNGLVDNTPVPKPVDNEPLIVGIVANIREVKRIDDALRAFAQVAADFPGILLKIVGGGDSGDLENLARELGVSDRVEFVGRSEDPASEIARFSIAMLTSESEGLSNAIIEYMQFGIPVVCTDTGGNPELVTHNETGLLAPVGDSDMLAAHLRRLVANDDDRRRLGSNARTSINEVCSTETMVEAHETAYGTLVA